MSETAFEQLVIEQLRVLARGHEEIKEEIVAVGMVSQQTLTQATRTNGRVDRLEAWQAKHRAFHEAEKAEASEALSFAAGAASERDRARRWVTSLWGHIDRYVIGGLFFLLVGVGIRLGSWFLGW